MQPETDVTPSSLLNQIITEVNKMDREQQQKLLMQLRRDAVLEAVKRLDATAAPAKQNSMTDAEADAYVSEQRKLRYEQSQA